MKTEVRQLRGLISVGPAMWRDFDLLGIRSVEQLVRQDAKARYDRLGPVARQQQDICVLDAVCAAVAQAGNPGLPARQCQWW